MSKTTPLYLTYCGLRIRLDLGRRSLCSAFSTVLKPFLTEPQKRNDLRTKILNKRRFQKKHAQLFTGLEKIGRRVFRRGRVIYVEKFVDCPGLSFFIDRRTAIMRMTVLVGDDFAAQCLDDKRVLQGFLMYFCYFPALWLLSQRRRIFPLHGGGVFYRKRGVLFAGLQGVGKSTLLLRMLRDPAARFLSDNVYLHDRSRAFACPETIRLDDASVGFIGGVKGILKATRYRSDLDRRMYVVEPAKFKPNLTPHIMIIPSFAERTQIRRITRKRAAHICMNFNELALELRSYHQFVAPFDFFEDARDRYADHAAVLTAFLSNTPAYELRIKPDGRPDRAIALIEKALDF